MPPECIHRPTARGLTIALGLFVAIGLFVAWPVSAESTDPTVSDVLAQQLPGHEAVQSLKRSLSVPSAASRWRGLPSFGRDLFDDALERFAPIEDTPVGLDYVLGPGDNLVVFISSISDTSFALTLDREGKVFLPRVGTTFLWGLSFADAASLIKDRIATVLRNARVQVSMGSLRALDVFVLGAALHPGKYTLTGLATAFNALSAAGGPNALGSLRDIRVLRGDKEVAHLDLYRFLLAGDRSNDARLQAGDVVFVGFIKTQIGIQGAVTRPGVYEGDGPITMRQLLEMAGGASPFADLSRIRIERVDPHGGFRLQDLPLNHGHGIDPDSLILSNFDLVTVLPLNERVLNAVTLDGFVRHPGEYELSPGQTLSDLLTRDRLLPEAALDQAELRRVDPETYAVEVQSFSVREVWAGRGDIALRPLDAVTVFSTARFPRSVTVEGEVTRPGTYTVQTGDRLSDVLERAGGVTTQGYLPAAIFLRRSAAEQERNYLQEFVKRERLQLAQQQAHLAQSGDSTGSSEISRAQGELLSALQQQAHPGRVVLDLDVNGKWRETHRDPVIEDGDHLIVPLEPATVTVLGNVMNPGTVMARKRGSFSDYVAMVGGPTRRADLKHSYVLRANGEAVPRGQAPRIQQGDAIIVPPKELSEGGFARSLVGSFRFVMEMAAATALVLAATK